MLMSTSLLQRLTAHLRHGALLTLLLIGSGVACAQGTSYQGMWWVAAESGWGFNIAHQGDVLATAWYTYDTDGKPLWLTMAASKQANGSYAGSLFRTTGRPFAQINGTPVTTGTTAIGTAQLTFTSANAAQLSYTINGVSQQKNMVRYNFSATPPTCAFSNSPMASASNYTDLWWNPSESGWGVNLIHQGDIVAAAWYTYDTAGNPMWLIASPGKQPDGSYAGSVFRATSGTPLLQINGSPAVQPGAMQNVGNVTLRFTDGEKATMSFTVDGVAQTKSIQRYAFTTPRSVCTAAATGNPGGNGNGQCFPAYSVGDQRTHRNTSQITGQPQVVGNSSEHVTATTTFEGHPVYVVENRDAQNRVTAKNYFEQTATELIQWGADTFDPATGQQNGTVRYSPEFRTPRTFNLNETVARDFNTITTVSVQGFTYTSTDRHQHTIKLIGYESTTVPAGTFSNACKMEVNDTVTAQATGTVIPFTSTLWASPNVGTVKINGSIPTTFGTSTTLVELLSATVGGVNFP
jgi:hypothetical protein